MTTSVSLVRIWKLPKRSLIRFDQIYQGNYSIQCFSIVAPILITCIWSVTAKCWQWFDWVHFNRAISNSESIYGTFIKLVRRFRYGVLVRQFSEMILNWCEASSNKLKKLSSDHFAPALESTSNANMNPIQVKYFKLMKFSWVVLFLVPASHYSRGGGKILHFISSHYSRGGGQNIAFHLMESTAIDLILLIPNDWSDFLRKNSIRCHQIDQTNPIKLIQSVCAGDISIIIPLCIWKMFYILPYRIE